MLLKGCEKKIICLRSTDSQLFDEAFFVLRHGPVPPQNDDDMLAEANRILEENLLRRQHRGRCHIVPLLSFFAGAALVGIAWLLFFLCTL